MAIIAEQREILLANILNSQILALKMDKLPLDSPVYRACKELIELKGLHVDSFCGKSVFNVIKKCYKAVVPKQSKERKLTRGQVNHRSKVAVIMQRRKNGDL